MPYHNVQDPTSLSRGGALEDVSLVDKYMLTDDQYDKMENTVRAYKRNKLAEDPNFKFKKLPGASMGGKRPDVESEACIAAINVCVELPTAVCHTPLPHSWCPCRSAIGAS